MLIKKIAFCGAPLAGKTTLLRAIAQITGSDRIHTRFGEAENVTRLDVSLPDRILIGVTISGVFYRQEQSGVLTALLKQADIIVYVCSTIPPQNAEPKYFTMYVTEATRLHVSWADIPWLFVLTKTDLSGDNPLQRFIPPQFHTQILACAALEGKGVAELWQRIVSIVS
jgi:ethanolamine utilization protein EutP (predicted NTPase)